MTGAAAVGDPDRLSALDRYAIIDTPSEASFDGLVRLAGMVCRAPIAVISFVQGDRQWFKARTGLDATETPIEHSVCSHALRRSEPLIIPDLTRDPRTSGNPLVMGPPHIRFYAGAPLITPDRQVLGTICVIDTVPRPEGLAPEQVRALSLLAEQVMALLALRMRLQSGQRHVRALRRDRDVSSDQLARNVLENASNSARDNRATRAQEAARIGTFELDVSTGRMKVSAEFCRIFGLSPVDEVDAATMEALVLPEDSAARSSQSDRMRGTSAADVEYRIRRPDDGEIRWISRRSSFDRDANGNPTTMFGTVHDITDRRLAGFRVSALAQLGDELRDVVDRDAVVRAALQTLGEGLDPDSIFYIGIEDDGLPVQRGTWSRPDLERPVRPPPLDAILARLRSTPGAEVMIDTIDHGGGRAFLAVPLRQRGPLRRFVCIETEIGWEWATTDIDFVRAVVDRVHLAKARIEAMEVQEILNRELSHRLKNSLTIAIAVARQSLEGVSPRDPVDALEGRLKAMSAAHDALVDREWNKGDLRSIAVKTIALLGQTNRIAIEGPDIAVSAKAAMSISLVLHELTTNAIKHGALSVDGGSVTFAWMTGTDDAGEPCLMAHWVERGGPAVVAPTTGGYGSDIIGFGLAGTGGTSVRYHPAGIEVEMRILLADFVAD